MEKRKDLVNCDGLQGQWCTRQELNLHFLSKIWTWTIRVCQFRHGCIFNFSLWIFTRLRCENRGGAYRLIHNSQDIVTEMNLHRGGATWTMRVCQFRHTCLFNFVVQISCELITYLPTWDIATRLPLTYCLEGSWSLLASIICATPKMCYIIIADRQVSVKWHLLYRSVLRWLFFRIGFADFETVIFSDVAEGNFVATHSCWQRCKLHICLLYTSPSPRD